MQLERRNRAAREVEKRRTELANRHDTAERTKSQLHAELTAAKDKADAAEVRGAGKGSARMMLVRGWFVALGHPVRCFKPPLFALHLLATALLVTML